MKKPLTTIERQNASKLFSRVVRKVSRSDQFEPEEKQAIKIIGRMIEGIANGWNGAGAPRMKKPTKSALYLRWNRANKRVENAIENGVKGTALTLLIDEAGAAERDYRNFKDK
jgi:hypothetical protein